MSDFRFWSAAVFGPPAGLVTALADRVGCRRVKYTVSEVLISGIVTMICARLERERVGARSLGLPFLCMTAGDETDCAGASGDRLRLIQKLALEPPFDQHLAIFDYSRLLLAAER